MSTDLSKTPFLAQKTAKQAIQFAIDPSQGLTRERYSWFSNGTRFDSSLFSEVEAGIRLATTATGTDEARIQSAFAGQYISQTLAQPGIGLIIDNGNVSTSGGSTTLSHGEVYAGAFFWDTANDRIDTGLGYKWDSSGWTFEARSLGTHIGNSPISQSEFKGPYDGSGPSNKVRTPADGLICNWPYTWYNEGPFGSGLIDNDLARFVEQVRTSESGRPSFDTPNLPVQLVVRNAGTASALGVELGGMQYSTYGATGVNQTRDTYGTNQGVSVTTDTPDPIAPTSTPGEPIYALQRETGEESLELRLDSLRVDAPNDVTVYFFDEYDPASALTDESFEDTFRFNESETKTQFDRSATAYSPSTAVFRGLQPVDSGKKNEDAVTQAEIEDRIPIGATRIVTATDDGGNNPSLNFVYGTGLEGY